MLTEECQKAVLLLIKKYGWQQVENSLYFDEAWQLYNEEYNERIAAGENSLAENLADAAHN